MSGAAESSQASMSPRFHPSSELRTNSTFSSDIALLRQPGGLEGLLPAHVVPNLTQLSGLEEADLRHRLLHRNAAAAGHAAPQQPDEQNLLTRNEKFRLFTV